MAENKNKTLLDRLNDARATLHSERDSSLIKLIDALIEYFTVKEEKK